MPFLRVSGLGQVSNHNAGSEFFRDGNAESRNLMPYLDRTNREARWSAELLVKDVYLRIEK